MTKTTRPRVRSLSDALARTRASGTCMIWQGNVKSNGYARTGVRGVRVSLHRWVYEQANGPIPEGRVIDHVCGRRSCINPKHLRSITQKQNTEHRVTSRIKASSGVRNVYWSKRENKWIVQAGSYGKKYHGGTFVDLDEAAEAAIALRNRLFTHNDWDRQSA